MANYIGNQLAQGEFRKLDDISSSFNGSTTTFNLTTSAITVIAGAAEQLIISVNGVIQEPLTSFTLSQGGSQITFSSAPPSGSTFFGVLFGGVGQANTPVDSSVTTAKIVDGAVTPAKLDRTYATPSDIDAVNAALALRVVKTSSTGAALVPVGTTAQRDGTPSAGYFRFNSSTNQFEGYNGTAWGAVGGGATGGANNPVFYENDQTVTVNYTITTGKNAMTAGPVTIADGVSVTIPDGSTWTIV